MPPNARACPECGSREETGWSEAATSGGLDLPDEEFEYDEFVKKEFREKTAKPHGISRLWWVVGIVMLAILLGLFLSR